MGTRRDARERAVQFLFQYDLNPADQLDAALTHFWESQQQDVLALDQEPEEPGLQKPLPPPSVKDASIRSFAEPLIRGTLQHRDEIDAEIKRRAENWDIQRMAVVDRNILRMAIYELLHREDIPPVVTINEAVDIAKKFSTEDSGKFVNGILDKIKGDLMRPLREGKA